ncbi:hypothetical protein FRC09_002769 [Ceratobasidium sp. 395]|nr:hypothetical protein FRC09_002769 [Ceratobasidium sp. 395]
MSNPAVSATPAVPIYTPVDHAQLVVPTDQANLHAFLQSIKDVLIAINHNLATYMQVKTANLTTAEATLQNHDASITNLDTLMVQALAGIAAVQGTGSSGQSTRAPKLTVPAKFDGSDKNKATCFRIKEILMTQNYDHLAPTVTPQLLADKALQIDQHLEAFQAQNKGAYTQSTSSGSKNTSLLSAASPGIARDKMSVGEKVYMLGSDGKAWKGTVQAIGKNDKGAKVPTIKWSDGSSTEVAFKRLKKDSYPGGAAAPTVVVATTTPSSKGPGPMDLDSTGKGKKPVICNNCGGRGHYANTCPSKSLSDKLLS